MVLKNLHIYMNMESKNNIREFATKSSGFQNVNYGDNIVGNSKPSVDSSRINQALLKDVSDAAKKAGVDVTITTAVSGHHGDSQKATRHDEGNAIDIAIVNGKGFSSKKSAIKNGNYDAIQSFVEALVSMGYTKNSESGNDKAVLTFGFPGHDNHVHVSRKSGSNKNDTNVVVNKPKSVGPVGLTQNFYKGEAKSNIDMIIGKMKNMGITNPMVQAAILATIGKESGFIPQNEVPYTNTDNSTIRKIFSSTKGLSDRKLDRLKKDPEDFFNYVYGPEGAGPGLGNTQRGDGYKYRGRGFNQITGRSNYKKYGFESNPDDLNNPDGAADAMLKFLAKEGSSLNDRFKSADEALEFFVTRNAGGTPTERGENKAREVLAKFQIGSEPGGDLASTTTSTPDKKEEKKKSILDLFGLGGLDAMIDLVKGDEKSFASSYGDIQKESVNEEVHRIKDIMKKIL